MADTPNRDNPQDDVDFLVEELLSLFNEAEELGEAEMSLNSCVGSKFHARVKRAAAFLAANPPK